MTEKKSSPMVMPKNLIERAIELPEGFEEHPGGLAIPIGAARSEERWTTADGKFLRRVERWFDQHHLLCLIGCREDSCVQNPLVARIATPDGYVLRCQHLDRRIIRSI